MIGQGKTESLYMNACKLIYNPCKSVLQMVQMLKNACEYCCESYDCVANEMRTCVANEMRTRHMGN